MKLSVLMKPAPGGQCLMLCDEIGEPLPMQHSLIISSEANDVARVAVEFLVDSDQVSMGGIHRAIRSADYAILHRPAVLGL